MAADVAINEFDQFVKFREVRRSFSIEVIV